MVRAGFILAFFILLGNRKAAAQLRLPLKTDSLPRNFSLRVLPQNFYNQHLGFTCRKETQLQKLTTLPIYIRLGSKDYVDYLEQKPHAFRKSWQ